MREKSGTSTTSTRAERRELARLLLAVAVVVEVEERIGREHVVILVVVVREFDHRILRDDRDVRHERVVLLADRRGRRISRARVWRALVDEIDPQPAFGRGRRLAGHHRVDAAGDHDVGVRGRAGENECEQQVAHINPSRRRSSS
jgi:hypothetical protein